MRRVIRYLLPPLLVAGIVALGWWSVLEPTVRLGMLAAGWLAAAWLAARLLDLTLDRAARRRGLAQAPRLVGDLARVLLFGVAVTMILALVLRQPVAGLVATSGVMIAVLGFALRNMIADVFSGIALNVEHPYRIGDYIELGPGLSGRVDEIDWRATRLITNDGTSIVVPNGLVAGRSFINHSFPTHVCRAGLRVTLDPGIPVERARRVLLVGVLTAPRILAEPRPDVVVDAISDQGVVYHVRYWLPDFGQEAACRDTVASSVLESLRHAGLEPARIRHELVRPRSTVAESGVAESGAAPARRWLDRVDLFRAFDGAERDRLAQAMREHVLPEGATVVRQGEPGTSLFVIAEGVLDVLLAPVPAAPGNPPAIAPPAIALDRLVPGDVFGEMSLLTGQPRSASVVAVTGVVVHELDRDTLDPLLRHRPELAVRLAELMADRQRRNEERRSAAGRVLPPLPPATSVQDLLRHVRRFFRLPA